MSNLYFESANERIFMQIGSHAKQLFQFYQSHLVITILEVISCNKHSITNTFSLVLLVALNISFIFSVFNQFNSYKLPCILTFHLKVFEVAVFFVQLIQNKTKILILPLFNIVAGFLRQKLNITNGFKVKIMF